MVRYLIGWFVIVFSLKISIDFLILFIIHSTPTHSNIPCQITPQTFYTKKIIHETPTPVRYDAFHFPHLIFSKKSNIMIRDRKNVLFRGLTTFFLRIFWRKLISFWKNIASKTFVALIGLFFLFQIVLSNQASL